MLRKDQFLKGPVRNVVTERLLKHGTRVDELLFSPEGRLIQVTTHLPDGREIQDQLVYDREGRRVRRNAELVSRNGGGWNQVQKLHLDTWSIDQLGARAFGTNSATTAETTFEASGRPVITLFRDQEDEIVSEIHYEHGRSGQLLSAVQSVDGDEYFRLVIEYNERGQMVEERLLFGGELTHKSSFEYNEFGDKAREIIEDERGNREQYKFEYKYKDPWENGTRQITHHPLGTDELRRTLSYYDQ